MRELPILFCTDNGILIALMIISALSMVGCTILLAVTGYKYSWPRLPERERQREMRQWAKWTQWAQWAKWGK